MVLFPRPPTLSLTVIPTLSPTVLSTIAGLPTVLQWVPEVRHFCPNTPFVLVGCKSDLRDDADTITELKKLHRQPVSATQAQQVADQIGAIGSIACSAQTKVGRSCTDTSGPAAYRRGALCRPSPLVNTRQTLPQKIPKLFILSSLRSADRHPPPPSSSLPAV